MQNSSSYKDKPTLATNAASSGINLDKKIMKNFAKRSDLPGLIFLLKIFLILILLGIFVYQSLGTLWLIPAELLFGTVLTVSMYSLSHEAAHGTAFKTRWVNEVAFWISSLIYMEEPLHRRYTHTNHHTFTWHIGKDTQMPFDTPMNFSGWVLEISGLALLKFHIGVMKNLVLRQYTEQMRLAVPHDKLPKLTRNARVFLLIYFGIFICIVNGFIWPFWFIILPRIMGTPIFMMFSLIQHVELKENASSILESTRSFNTNWFARLIYMNMNFHVEHHLYPQIPFHSLPNLNKVISYQLPKPDPGFWKTNWEVLLVVIKRSLGLNTKANTIRQAPHMISNGFYNSISKKSM